MNQSRSNSTPAPNTTLDIHHTPAATTRRQDPLAVLERELLAHPGSHHHAHHCRHPTVAQRAGHLAPPTLSAPNAASRSRTPSPEPTAGARRCMAATAAWIPLTEDSAGRSSSERPEAVERRQSWDGQAYRHAIMMQTTGLACACHPNKHGEHAKGHGIDVPPRNSYEADRGFSEASR